MPIATLPMYDWPEIRSATDALWQHLAGDFRRAGLDAPATLSRAELLPPLWLDPDLLLAQCCGRPFVEYLEDHVAIVCGLDYQIERTQPGDYHSIIIVHRSEKASTLRDMRYKRLAFNDSGSQSGCHAMIDAVAPLAGGQSFFSACQAVGSHRQALRAVASGEADIAAIDAVSFALAQRHEPQAAEVRVLQRTRSNPGLPLICGPRAPQARLRDTVIDSLSRLPQSIKDDLLIRGPATRQASDFECLRTQSRQAAALGYSQLH